MSYRSRQSLKEHDALISAAQPSKDLRRAGRVFDLHPILFAGTIGGYGAFLAIMAATFMNPPLVIPFVIFFFFLAMAFGVPGLWGKVAGVSGQRYQTWAEFRREGLDVATGHLGASGVIIQVLILPGLLVFWGVIVASIAVCV